MTPQMDAFVPRRFTSADRVMWLTPDRIFYAGLLGAPILHTKGAIIAYVAIEGSLQMRIGAGEWQTGEVVVVQPYVAHEIACDARHVLDILIEPETVDRASLPPLLKACGAVHAPEFAAHVRAVHQSLVATGGAPRQEPSSFDQAFFGHALPARTLDPRIAAILEQVKHNPSALAVAEECAAHVDLSFSRFLHLFKKEVGASFRCMRTWKRARSVLQHVHSGGNLVYVALDTGYTDSTHFSRSIRQTYGLKPKDIFAGSRKLRVIAQPAASPVC